MVPLTVRTKSQRDQYIDSSCSTLVKDNHLSAHFWGLHKINQREWTDIYGKTQSPGLAIVNTCPSAALCKSFCYATKGFYTMYSAPSISAAQVLSFLINHPEQFANNTAANLKTQQTNTKKQT